MFVLSVPCPNLNPAFCMQEGPNHLFQICPDTGQVIRWLFYKCAWSSHKEAVWGGSVSHSAGCRQEEVIGAIGVLLGEGASCSTLSFCKLFFSLKIYDSHLLSRQVFLCR